MKLSEKLKEKILTDNDFSLDLAKVMNVRQDWVLRAAKLGSNRLMLPDAAEVYRQYGFKDSEMFVKK